MKLLVVVPAFNEKDSILNTIRDLQNFCPMYDYIVVNDGSADNTADICRENGINLLDLPVNLGLSGAFQAGMKYAYIKGYDAVLQFDADGQHSAEYIPAMVAKLQEGYDIIIGSRFVTEAKPKSMRMLGSNLIAFAIKLMSGQELRDPTSGMRLYSRRIVRLFAKQINIEPEPDTIAFLIQNGAKVAEVQVQMRERMFGESYLNAFRSMGYMLQMGISIICYQKLRRRIELD